MSWTAFDYESDMFYQTLRLCESGEHNSYLHPIPNAIVESLLLHVRNLVEILTSRGTCADDLGIDILLPNFSSPRIDELRDLYGHRKETGTPCWTLNKMLVHATSVRSDSHDYLPTVEKLAPCIKALIGEVQQARGKNLAQPQTTTVNMVTTFSASTKSS